jgi:hypothetical protein
VHLNVCWVEARQNFSKQEAIGEVPAHSSSTDEVPGALASSSFNQDTSTAESTDLFMFLTGKLRSRLNSHFRISRGRLVSVDIAESANVQTT